MEYLVDQERMQEVDRITIEEIGIPSMVLMERAALKVTELVQRLTKKEDRTLVICGSGNNGGDGMACARQLYQAGWKVEVYLVGNQEHLSVQAREQLEILRNIDVPQVEQPDFSSYSMFVDAIFGVGLSRPITGKYKELIEQINQSDGRVVAVDLPSGINANDGFIMNVAIHCDYTVTFGYNKLGLIRYPGREYAGTVFVEDIGFPDKALQQVMKAKEGKPVYFTYGRKDLKRFPLRSQNSHKGTFGTVLVIAGSKNMSGACYFSAKAAYRTGAGLVKILTVEENRIILQTTLPEAVVSTYDKDTFHTRNDCQRIEAFIHSADAVVIGPGLGQSELAKEVLEFTLQTVKVPLIMDADAINLLAKKLDESMGEVKDKKLRMEIMKTILPAETVLTPHIKEFSRLLEVTISKIFGNFLDTIEFCPYNKNLTYIIKDSQTLVANCGKRYFNLTGNDGLATGGSGDVLTGIIAALIVQGMDSFEASCLAVYMHGLTAERYAKKHTTYSMLASDIIEQLKDIMEELL